MTGKKLNSKNYHSSPTNYPIKNILNQENHESSTFPEPEGEVGGKKEKCEILDKLGQTINQPQPPVDGEEMGEFGHVNNFNIGKSNNQIREIDDNKLLIPLHVNRNKCKTHNDLYYEIQKWWNSKNQNG